MPKKVPVRIGLTKKTTEPDPDLDADISDLMSASTMEVLEQEDGGLYELPPDLEDELERDADPDYVPEQSTSAVAATKGKRIPNRPDLQPKRTLNLVSNDTPQSQTDRDAGKGRSNAPIWKFFKVSDRQLGGGQVEKGAVCIVEVGGFPCDKRIMQNGSSTTGLNQHLERRHPKEYTAYKLLQTTLQAERLSTKRTLVDHFEDLEGKLIVSYRQFIVLLNITINLSFHIVNLSFYKM